MLLVMFRVPVHVEGPHAISVLDVISLPRKRALKPLIFSK